MDAIECIWPEDPCDERARQLIEGIALVELVPLILERALELLRVPV